MKCFLKLKKKIAQKYLKKNMKLVQICFTVILARPAFINSYATQSYNFNKITITGTYYKFPCIFMFIF